MSPASENLAVSNAEVLIQAGTSISSHALPGGYSNESEEITA
jgi:hypothetical protein